MEVEIKEEKVEIISCDQGKREDLPRDILANIFKRLNVWDLMFLVPLVCHCWSSASMDPICWRVVDMRLYVYSNYEYKFSPYPTIPPICFGTKPMLLMREAVNRAGEHILQIIFAEDVSLIYKDLIYISERTPRLKRLVLPRWTKCFYLSHFSEALHNWRELEAISFWLFSGAFGTSSELSNHLLLESILEQIETHSNNLKELKLYSGNVGCREASVIAKYIPKLKSLDISMSYLSEAGLSTLLDRCIYLKCLNISHCTKFDETSEFDPFLLHRATSLLEKFYCCSRHSGDICQMCNIINSPIYRHSMVTLLEMVDIWMLGDLGFQCDIRKISPYFFPYYLVAVVTGEEQRFNFNLDSYMAWEEKMEQKRKMEEPLRLQQWFQQLENRDESWHREEKKIFFFPTNNRVR